MIRAEEPIVFGEPINLVITATSNVDISDLGISLIIWPHSMVIGEGQGEEDGIEVWKGPGGVDWKVNIEAGQVVTLHRMLYLPQEYGEYQITVHASTPQLRVVDGITLYKSAEDIKVYLPGTAIPVTRSVLSTIGPERLQTLQALPTSTALRTITPKPTHTSTSTPYVYPPPATPPWDAPGKTPHP